MPMRPSSVLAPAGLKSVLVHTAAAVAAIAAITFLYTRIVVVNSTTVALSYLLVILVVAGAWGLVEAVVASFTGAICLTLFMPPIGVFWVADPDHGVALVTFLVTSVVVSQLSAHATRRRAEMERLYALSRALIILDPKERVPRQVAERVRATFGIPGVALFHGETEEIGAAGPADLEIPISQLRESAVKNRTIRDSPGGFSISPLSPAGSSFGSIAFAGRLLSETAEKAIAGLASMALEQAKIRELAGRVEAARQSERLKSTLLDAIAHEFKTPLTSIKAAASLLETDENAPRLELLSIIAEETDYLDTLLGEAIQMGRIEAGMLNLDRQPHPVEEVLSAAISRMAPALKDRAIKRDIPAHVPELLVDLDLVGLALRQLINNAIKYSPPDLPVDIRVSCDGDRVQITVEDKGPGIPESEQARIFDRYYRIPSASSIVPGTGMGLPIAREIFEAHGGSLWVRSTVGQGSQFHVTLPSIIQG